MTEIHFSKWEGLGNDFLIIDSRRLQLSRVAELAQAMCDRHYGAGADGLVLLTGSAYPDGGAPSDNMLGMKIINSDGSSAQMCGNAIRCLAAYVHKEGILQSYKGVIDFTTPAGIRTTRLLSASPWWIEVDMGKPTGWGSPDNPGRPSVTEVQLDGSPYEAWQVSVGNRHLVIPVTGLDSLPWEKWGRRLSQQFHPEQGGVNVEFVEIQSQQAMVARVWERGAGPTLAYGTGACAALTAMVCARSCHKIAQVILPGGALEVEWARDGNLLLRGPARHIYAGVWNPDPT